MELESKIQTDNNNESSASDREHPGKVIRPEVADGAVREIMKRMYGLIVVEIKELNSYYDRNYFVMVDEKHLNKSIPHQHGYVLKIHNSKDSQNPAFFEIQHSFMSYLTNHGIPTQSIVPNLNGENCSLEETSANQTGQEGTRGKHMVELRTFIPGLIVKEAPYTPELLIQDGQLIARMSVALEDFHHSCYGTHDPVWNITNVPRLTDYTFFVDKEKDRLLIEDIVGAFKKEVVPLYGTLPRGVIHGDLNEQNIIVSQDASSGQYNINGIIDFSEIAQSYPIWDLAINIAYLMIDSDVVDQLDAPGYILAGYLGTRDLTPAEWAALPFCIAGRLAQSLTLGAHAHHMEPENEYVISTAKKGWPLLYKYWSYSREDLIGRWRGIVRSRYVTGHSDVGTE